MNITIPAKSIINIRSGKYGIVEIEIKDDSKENTIANVIYVTDHWTITLNVDHVTLSQ